MIQAFTGFPGHGKSFACTHIAWKEMRKGRRVFTNYAVKGAYKVTFDDIVNYTFPPGSVVIIDEGGRWFNSRDWSKLPPAVFDLFTLHRHMRLDLYVAVQNFARIDVALREVIELVWWARNYFISPWFIYDGYYNVEKLGMKGESDKRLMISKFSRSRKIYDTHSMSKAVNKDEIPLIPWDGAEDSRESPGEPPQGVLEVTPDGPSPGRWMQARIWMGKKISRWKRKIIVEKNSNL